MAITPEGEIPSFKTYDMQEAAFLVASGHRFPQTELIANRRARFAFDDSEGDVAWDAEQYRMGSEDCMVNVRHLWKAFDALKRTLPKLEGRR